MGLIRATAFSALLLGGTCMTINKEVSFSIEARAGWTFLGCYTDNVSGRALPNGEQVPGGSSAMTVEACESTCRTAGFSIAGLEYAGECWCGNAITNGGGPAPDGSSGCNMKCNGNSAETCGGPNRLDVYSYGSGVSPTTTTSASSSSATGGNPLPGWNFLGCYTDNVSGRALTTMETVSGGATNEGCQSACIAAGFSIAGTEYAGECWCGNAIINGGGPAPDGSAQCNMACKGNTAEICGGPNRLDVYQHGSGGGTTPPPPSNGKRGLAYNNNNPGGNSEYANLFKGYGKVSWGYDWGYPSYGLDSSFEFVPMLWGLPSGSDPGWTAAVQTGGTKNILGFNEPDLTYSASSNILPANAAAGYKTYMEPFANSIKIGMPNVLWNNVGSSSGGSYDSAQWTQYFLGNCTGCHFDFAAIHYYQDCNPADGQRGASWFQGNITNAWQTLKLPVWITEFQCYGTDAQQVAFLQQVLPWMDAQSYVARYAYFGVFPNYLINTAGNGLSDIGMAYATT